MSPKPVPRPFLKWAGGKTQVADLLVSCMPPPRSPCTTSHLLAAVPSFFGYIVNSAFAALSSPISMLNCIDTYVAIRDAVTDVMRLLAEFPHAEAFYYDLRAKHPWQLSLPERAARMIYLNKTGYNGLYRVNRQGQFNVPFGRPTSSQYVDKENLL